MHNYVIMKRIVLILFVLAVGISAAFGQKTKGKGTAPITTEQRMISSTFADGLKDFYTGDYTGAERHFRSVIERDSKHGAAYYLLGNLKSEQGDKAAAEEYLRRACACDKQNVWYFYALAQQLDEMERYKESVKVWDQVCRMQPANEEFLLSYASAMFMTGNFKKTIQILDRVEDLIGINEQLTQMKVDVLLQGNDIKGAVGVYDKLIAQNPNEVEYYTAAAGLYFSNNMASNALPYLEKAAALAPNDGAVQLALAQYQATQGHKEEADKAFLQAMRSPELDVEKKLDILRLYLASLPKEGVTPQEIKMQMDLSEALTEVNPEVAEGWAAMASIYMRQREYVKATPYFDRALEIDPSQYYLWQDYLICLAKSNNYQRIIELEDTIIELFPTNSMVNFTLGSAYLNSGKPATAIKYFEKALKYTYDKTEMLHIYNALAEAYEVVGDTAKAAEYRKKANKK